MASITPTEQYNQLGKAIGISGGLSFKREDLHPYGSHKGRSIPVMIDHYVKNGDHSFAISSSGNAGLAAALYTKELNSKKSSQPIKLDVYIGLNAAPHKAERLKELADDHIRVLVKERPIQALTQAVTDGYRSLRQSTDDTAMIGYESLAIELMQSGKAGTVFVGTSSGTTAEALAQYFLDNKSAIQVHIVQTSSCHPMVDAFESYDGPDEASIADAIVDKVAHRKDKLVPLIKKTGGRGWTVTNDEIEAAQDLVLEHTGLEISTNSALSVAGLMKAAALGHEFNGAVICMICGE
ncbi:MAG: PLP-dependent lyase/thiolase [Candidatus Taylorbacteria bacterium]|nr:PLP-dependent lyase/thiolase [Candidatus Taylorbacteria bacterium]